MQSESLTQERILDAAQALFARRGISATSLRSITTKAGVNAAAIHYHFGSKQDLVSTILTRRVAPLSEERIKRLEQLEGRYRDEAIPTALLVEAFVTPFASAGRELRVELPRLGSLLAWLRVEGDGDPQMLGARAADVSERFALALCRHRALGLDESRDRIHYATGSLVQLLWQEPVAENATPTEAELDTLQGRLSRLIGFLAAGLAAPATPDRPESIHRPRERALETRGNDE